MLMGSYGVWWSKDSIWKGYGGEYMGYRYEGYFWGSNLSKSKKTLVYFEVLKGV
jgi:hypothetical protein